MTGIRQRAATWAASLGLCALSATAAVAQDKYDIYLSMSYIGNDWQAEAASGNAHSTAVAEIAKRFVARHRPRSLVSRMANAVLTHRADGIYKVGPDQLGVAPRWPRI